MADFKESRLPKSLLLNLQKRERILNAMEAAGPRLSADFIIPRLPKMDLGDTANFWRAAIAEVQDSQPSFQRERELKRIIQAICGEWGRRFKKLPHQSKRVPRDFDDDDDAEEGSVSKLQPLSPLRMVGYTVNAFDAYSDRLRAGILEHLQEETLPPVGSQQYMRTWGMNDSEKRLKKIAGLIAGSARRAWANDPALYACALAKWDLDLAHLRKWYYEPRRFDFKWPCIWDAET
jgi:hypothetical protein